MGDKKSYGICCGESKVLAAEQPDPSLKDSAHSKILQAINSREEEVLPANPNVNYKWARRFLNLADEISMWSHDPSTKCGAIIVDTKQRIISTGYNGFARGVEDTDERLNDRETKYALTIHAEINAIMFANTSLEGCTLYTTPIPPCIRCATQIIQVGIKTVISRKMIPQIKKRWGASTEFSKQIFLEAGVDFIEI